MTNILLLRKRFTSYFSSNSELALSGEESTMSDESMMSDESLVTDEPIGKSYIYVTYRFFLTILTLKWLKLWESSMISNDVEVVIRLFQMKNVRRKKQCSICKQMVYNK